MGIPRVATALARHLAALLLAGSTLVAAQPYEATVDSLRTHAPFPDWVRDGKLGIYAHWGVFSVPAFGNEWYPSYMFDREGVRNKLKVYEHHVATYGDPAVFGYHDFVPLFTGAKFDAGAWADLYRRAGARFGGTVTEHHDGFSMWASAVNPWNAKDLGPKRDVVGELATALRAQGLKVIATFHHARMYGTRNGREYWTRAPGWPTTSEDPRLRLLYGNIPFADGMRLWRQKLDEVVTGYRPDLVWFDVDLELVPVPDRLAFIASYFNAASAWDAAVAVITKRQIPSGIGIPDYENHYPDRLTPEPWMTDDTIGTVGSVWSYVPGMRIKTAAYLVQELLDIISKNGHLLLNLSPRADGTIPEDQQAAVLGLGSWLEAHGNAVYGTRTWTVSGEGRPGKAGPLPTFLANADEVRYTCRGPTVYATRFGNQSAGTVLTLKAFTGAVRVADVTLQGSATPLVWRQGATGLEITLPAVLPDPMANVLVIATVP